jgi:hypothetical protein
MKPDDDVFRARIDQILAEMKASGLLRSHAKRHGLEPIVAP